MLGDVQVDKVTEMMVHVHPWQKKKRDVEDYFLPGDRQNGNDSERQPGDATPARRDACATQTASVAGRRRRV